MSEKTSVQDKPAGILTALQAAQAEQGYLSRPAIEKVAASLGVPVSDVYGVASFYSFLSVKPLGRNVVRVCRNLPCHIKGGAEVVAAVAKALGIAPGETTADGRYSLELTNCVGLCDGSPAMLVNEDAHQNLAPEKVAGILANYK